MSEPKWTAGEWFLEPDDECPDDYIISAPDDGSSPWRIARVYADCGNDGKDTPHNAALIIAAADLYAALAPLADADPDNPPFGVSVDDWRAAVHAARTARAKARGETT